MTQKLLSAIVISSISIVNAVLADTREDILRAQESMKVAANGVQQGINDAQVIIRDITGENAAARTNELLEAIRLIENKALNTVDQLALNGPFINALNDVQVKIRQTMKTVEKMEASTNRDSNLTALKRQSERFNEMQLSILKREGEITNLVAKLPRLRGDIEISLRIIDIDEMIGHLENVESNLAKMAEIVQVLLNTEVGEVEEVVVTN